MKRTIALLSLFTFMTVSAFAGQAPGLEKKGKVPGGFEQGSKVGWKNEYPSGWDKKSEKEKHDWEQTVENGRKEVSTSAKEKGMTGEETESAADDFDFYPRTSLEDRSLSPASGSSVNSTYGAAVLTLGHRRG